MTAPAPIVVTRRAPRILASGKPTKRAEIWEARTADGVWLFERADEPGTPWLIFRAADRFFVTQCGSLRKARHAVAMGWIGQMLRAEEVRS